MSLGRRTVEGVVLERTAPDAWTANGWTFRVAEGQSLGGHREWWAYNAQSHMTVHTSLKECVRTMLRTTRKEKEKAS